MKVWGFFMLCWIQNCKCQHFFVYCGMNKKYQKYIDYIVNDIELPYLKSLEQYGLTEKEYELVLSKVFNQPLTIKDNYVFDSNGYITYIENSIGDWIKREYDGQGNEIYYEDSNGDWIKREYDEQGNRIYYEDSNGEIDDNR